MAFPAYYYPMLSLTKREQTVLVLMLAALILGAGIRHFRMIHMLPEEAAPISKTR